MSETNFWVMHPVGVEGRIDISIAGLLCGSQLLHLTKSPYYLLLLRDERFYRIKRATPGIARFRPDLCGTKVVDAEFSTLPILWWA